MPSPGFLSRQRLAHSVSALWLAAAAPLAAASTASGTLAFTSDYVWRGVSQSQGDPAAQAGFRLAAAGGLYASAWGSSVAFAAAPHAHSELDLVVGWSGALAPDWALDANLTHYRYPSARADLDWTEANATLTWKQRCWVQLGVSDDVMAAGTHGSYAQLGARLPLGAAVRLEAALGQYGLDAAYGDRYRHGQLGVVWAVRAPLELRLTAHDTDAAAARLFPGAAGSRVEAAVQASF